MTSRAAPVPILALSLSLASLGLVSLGLAPAARAGDDAPPPNPAGDKAELLARTYGSTIVSTYPDGRQAELWLKPDGTYDATGRTRKPSSGVWQVKGDKLCMRQRRPIPAPFSYCAAIPANGDFDHPWQGKAFTGETISIRVVRGMRGRDAKPGQPPQPNQTQPNQTQAARTGGDRSGLGG